MSTQNSTPDPLAADPLKAAVEAEAVMDAGTPQEPQPAVTNAAGSKPPKDKRAAIIAALMDLAAERRWEDISMTDVATSAGLTLSDFRDFFPSKGAILAAFSRMIDKIVLDGTTGDLAAEPAKERLFDVLMRRLDAMAPYREGLQGVMEWARRDPISAAALNQVALNSMRFMLEAADISAEGPVGTIKMQGLVLAWARVLDVWFRDDDPAYARTMAALDRELTRGEKLVARAEDVNRLTAPLRSIASAFFSQNRRREEPRTRERWSDIDGDPDERRAHTL
ncbi:MAG: TetR family transcriptional regulator [Hyphomicrobiales bacterium]|nr:TetR family transcriptional regulator [Hyphomicrobiales bacterium]